MDVRSCCMKKINRRGKGSGNRGAAPFIGSRVLTQDHQQQASPAQPVTHTSVRSSLFSLFFLQFVFVSSPLSFIHFLLRELAQFERSRRVPTELPSLLFFTVSSCLFVPFFVMGNNHSVSRSWRCHYMIYQSVWIFHFIFYHCLFISLFLFMMERI